MYPGPTGNGDPPVRVVRLVDSWDQWFCRAPELAATRPRAAEVDGSMGGAEVVFIIQMSVAVAGAACAGAACSLAPAPALVRYPSGAWWWSLACRARRVVARRGAPRLRVSHLTEINPRAPCKRSGMCLSRVRRFSEDIVDKSTTVA